MRYNNKNVVTSSVKFYNELYKHIAKVAKNYEVFSHCNHDNTYPYIMLHFDKTEKLSNLHNSYRIYIDISIFSRDYTNSEGIKIATMIENGMHLFNYSDNSGNILYTTTLSNFNLYKLEDAMTLRISMQWCFLIQP